MRQSLATSVFLRALLNDEFIHIHGDGKQTRCYTHVDMSIKGFKTPSLSESKENGVFNVTGEEEVQNRTDWHPCNNYQQSTSTLFH